MIPACRTVKCHVRSGSPLENPGFTKQIFENFIEATTAELMRSFVRCHGLLLPLSTPQITNKIEAGAAPSCCTGSIQAELEGRHASKVLVQHGTCVLREGQASTVLFVLAQLFPCFCRHCRCRCWHSGKSRRRLHSARDSSNTFLLEKERRRQKMREQPAEESHPKRPGCARRLLFPQDYLRLAS